MSTLTPGEVEKAIRDGINSFNKLTNEQKTYADLAKYISITLQDQGIITTTSTPTTAESLAVKKGWTVNHAQSILDDVS